MDPDNDPEFSSRRPYETPEISVLPWDARDITLGPGPSWIEIIGTEAVATAIIPYVQAIATELGNRTVNKASTWIHCRLRWRRNQVKSSEIDVGSADSVTTIELTGKLSDEAKLMLLDLDLNSPQNCGKLLRWDAEQGAWMPYRNPRGKRVLRRKQRQRGKHEARTILEDRPADAGSKDQV